jgi:hypothetical protein
MFTYAEARAAGISDQLLRRLLRDGVILKLRANSYLAASAADPLVAVELYLRKAAFLLQQLEGDYLLARDTAALYLGLRTPRRYATAPEKVYLYTADNRNSCTRAGLHVAVSPLHPGDTDYTRGVPSTSLARTAIDVSRGHSLSSSLIALDHALLLGVDRDALSETADRLRKWRGTKILRTAIPLADARSESALESATRGACLAAGLPPADLQVPLRGQSGRTYRVDLYWPLAGLVVEPDGLEKYGQTEDQRRQAFAREKEREDDLRAADYTVIRVTWKTLPERVGAIARHLRRIHVL